jgi:hypothetical protein
MPDIQIGAKLIEKLFNNLNPHKACGPDKIKPITLNPRQKLSSVPVSTHFPKSS